MSLKALLVPFALISAHCWIASAQSQESAAMNSEMIQNMQKTLGLSATQAQQTERILSANLVSSLAGQGTGEHAESKDACWANAKAHGVNFADTANERICGAKYMVPVYSHKKGQNKETAPLCIDEFEYPNMPCDYPVTWVSARDAAQLCEAEGKRLCDAHEWEGACAGELLDPAQEYDFASMGDHWGRKAAAATHNSKRQVVYAYIDPLTGRQARTAVSGICGDRSSGGHVTSDCVQAIMTGHSAIEIWSRCQPRTWPSGSFLECKSPFGVYDQHGNAAEHMNLPASPSQMTSRGGHGFTEMKNSYFTGPKDGGSDQRVDCRWREPRWHETQIMSGKSHQNYHLGFRCCKNTN